MSRNVEMYIALFFVGLAATYGAWISKVIKNGGFMGWYIFASIGLSGTWVWMAKRSAWPLLVTSTAWNIAHGVFWIGTTIFILKEGGTPMQMAGGVIVAIGLAIMTL